VAYANDSPRQVLDLFVPEGKGPFPLVINIHGGAFKFGDRQMLDAPIARAFLKEGIAVATINYRLSGEAKFPAAIRDAKSALRFLRAHAAKYLIDPARIIVFGQSAGGNLASLIGTSAGEPLFDDGSGISDRVSGVIDWFGPSDFSKMDEQAKAQGCPPDAQTHGEAGSPESLYLGAPLAEVPHLVAQANPITYISADDSPFLLQKGTEDCMVPVGQSQILHDALKTAGVDTTLVLLDGAGHGDMGSKEPHFLSPENIERVVAFVKRVTSNAAGTR
jgi:acetyl esterase/lipase